VARGSPSGETAGALALPGHACAAGPEKASTATAAANTELRQIVM
jgi:hypothetical protein